MTVVIRRSNTLNAKLSIIFERYVKRKKRKKEHQNVLIIEISSTDLSHISSIIELMNRLMTKKTIDFERTDHIFCNKNLFTFLILSKFCIFFEIEIENRFSINEIKTMILHFINENNKTFDVSLSKVLFSSFL
jgi:hypothetical protein